MVRPSAGAHDALLAAVCCAAILAIVAATANPPPRHRIAGVLTLLPGGHDRLAAAEQGPVLEVR